ncbi:hypothetical protein F5880DRAFT_1493254 [Lentinula raphanica]|nr:hypothetical protein F5880DRAFT_1493254 [Lentinula raphanica]
MTRHWSLIFHTIFLPLYIAVGLHFCRANNTNTGATSFSTSIELLQEFRRHYHAFDSAVHQVANDQTDVFHLRLLLEDIDEFSTLVSQESHHGHPDVLTWRHSGSAGRPRADIDPDFLRWAYTHRSVTGIADFLGLSRRTVRRSLVEYGISRPGDVPFEDQVPHHVEGPSNLHPEIEHAATLIQSSSSSTRCSNMSNETLDSFVRLLRSHYPRAGVQMLQGILRRLGQQPTTTVRQQSFPSFYLLQQGMEFPLVCAATTELRTSGSLHSWNMLGDRGGDHISGDGISVHNVRIERLWVDVSTSITQRWNDYFTHLEADHQLDVDNPNHIWLLQHLFLDVINQSLYLWAEGWNCHSLSQRHSDGPTRSPEDLFGFDMLTHGLRGDSLDQFTMSDEELKVFGVDWEVSGIRQIHLNSRTNHTLSTRNSNTF